MKAVEAQRSVLWLLPLTISWLIAGCAPGELSPENGIRVYGPGLEPEPRVTFPPQAQHSLPDRLTKIRRMPGDHVSAVGFSHGGTIMMASNLSEIHLWEVVGFKHIAVLDSAMCCVPPGETLVSWGQKDAVFRRAGLALEFVDTDTGKPSWRIPGPDNGVAGIAVSADGRFLAAAVDDPSAPELRFQRQGSVRIWDIRTRKEIGPLRGHQGVIRSLDFSPDGKLLLTGGEDGTVRLWDTSTAKEVRPLGEMWGGVRAVAFSDSGTLAFLAGVPKGLKIVEVGTGKVVCEQEEFPWRGGRRDLSINTVAFSGNGQMAFAGTRHGLICWDLQRARVFREITCQTPVFAVAVSRDSKRVVAGSSGWLIVMRIDSDQRETGG